MRLGGASTAVLLFGVSFSAQAILISPDLGGSPKAVYQYNKAKTQAESSAMASLAAVGGQDPRDRVFRIFVGLEKKHVRTREGRFRDRAREITRVLEEDLAGPDVDRFEARFERIYAEGAEAMLVVTASANISDVEALKIQLIEKLRSDDRVAYAGEPLVMRVE